MIKVEAPDEAYRLIIDSNQEEQDDGDLGYTVNPILREDFVTWCEANEINVLDVDLQVANNEGEEPWTIFLIFATEHDAIMFRLMWNF